MKIRYCYLMILSVFIAQQTKALVLQNARAGFEKQAEHAGAKFVALNPGATQDEVRRFCSNKYPIMPKNGMMDEIATRQQTACVVGGNDALAEINEEIEEIMEDLED